MSVTNQSKERSLKAFIAQLEKLNITLWLDGEKLRCKAPKEAVTQEIRQRLQENKQEIIHFLQEKGDEGIFYEPIPSVPEREYYPLSAAQKRMFIMNRIDRESTAYNLTQVLRIEGDFDRERFLHVFEQIAARHESLRTSFQIVDGEPVQIIHKSVKLDADCAEICGTEEDIPGLLREFIRPFDLEQCPLFRIKILKMQQQKEEPIFYVVLDMHHIISDGISVGILISEINALYAQKALPVPQKHYRDYAAWHERLLSGKVIERQKEYWENQLSGELPVLNFPADFKRPEKFTFQGDSVKVLLDAELTKQLGALARKNRVTMFSLLLCAYTVLLYKYTGQKDIIIGTSTAGRRHADVAEMIGVFINTLALRNYPSGEKSFAEFLREVGENALAAFDKQDYPFEKLVEELGIKRDPARNPVFDAMFILQNMNIGQINAEGTRISYCDYKKKIAQFDLSITATEFESGIEMEIDYCTSLYKRETIERLGSHFAAILKSVAANENLRLGEIDILSDAEKDLLFNQYNNTVSPYPEQAMIHELFEAQARKNPDAAALIFKGKQMSYGELNTRADALAKTLSKKGVGKDSIVGLMVERSFDMIIGLLGVLKAGGAYLPLDPEYPADRIRYMLEDSGTKILLSHKKLYERLVDGETSDHTANAEFVDMASENAYSKDGELNAASDPHSLAYVIYTSGSTGKPKGVMLEHKSVVNFIQGVTERIAFSADSTILCLTTISFDIFVLETLLPLSQGTKIVIADENEQRDSKLLNAVIAQNGVDMLQMTPSRLQLLLHGTSDLSCLSQLRTIMVGGEPFPQNLLPELEKRTKAKVYNMYGPTETTVWSTIGALQDENAIDIGTPIANTRVYLLDKDGNPVPPGVAGELCIGGDGLARGYLNRPELTNDKFVPDRFCRGGKIYKTGDLARWNSNGKLECLGRIDQQVKIRGYRIELGEIEKQLSAFGGVQECIVAARTDKNGIKYLAAYYRASKELPVPDLRSHLSKNLPEYMVPAVFVYMAQLPYTPNGKIDKKALPEPDGSRPMLGTEFKCAVSECEKTLSSIWQNVLKCELVGVEDNFFELGGNSLNLIKMHAEIEKAYPGKVTVTDIFAHPTIAKLAQLIDGLPKEQQEPSGFQEDTKTTGLSDLKDIAIIGMSGSFGFARNTEEYWQALKEGKDFVCPLPRQRKADSDVYLDALACAGMHHGAKEYFNAAFLDRIDCFDCGMFNISPREADLMDPNQRFFLETAWGAIEDAGYGGKKLTGTKTGVFVGHSSDFGVEYKDYGKTVSSANDEIAVSGNIRSIIGSRLSYILDLKGPCVTIDTACSSALVAVHEACKSLRCGECQTAVAGACKISIVPEKNGGKEGKLGIEATSERSNTFDESADGMGFGEGGGAVLLKPLGRAVADGDHIYAVIRGSAINQDGASLGITAPNMAAQQEVIQSAWQDAGIDPQTVTYIETHGTGTKLGDPIEIAGITKAFERFTQKKQFCAVASVKTNVGHLDNASGIASLIKAVLCLQNRQLPATLHFNNPNRKINFENSPVYVNDRLSAWESDGTPRRCGVSSFGLSGTNCHMVLEEYRDQTPKTQEQDENSGEKSVMTLSARNEASLTALLESYDKWLAKAHVKNLRDLCYTANTGRGHYNFRLAILADSIADLKHKISLVREKGLANLAQDEIYFGRISVVAPSKKERQAGEVTLEEIRGLSQSANALAGSLANGNAVSDNSLQTLCENYVRGAEIAWDKLYVKEKCCRLSLPVYPFLRERHWVTPDHIPQFKQNEPDRIADEKPNEIKPVTLKGRKNGLYSETEKSLGGIWGKALGFDEISVYDDFFELGGNSLVAIKVETYAEQNHLPFGASELYEHRTIEQLAAHLSKDQDGQTSEMQQEIETVQPPEQESGLADAQIENIRPFNDIFYRSCFYNSFFPVVLHFNRSILPFLVNDTAVFAKKEEAVALSLDVAYCSAQPTDQLLQQEGLFVETRTFDSDILDTIKSALQEKKPVIVWVDCFYESIRSDFYNKQHWAHTILIYGFQEAEQSFYVIEHGFADSLSYEKKKIGFTDMLAMCKGYMDNFFAQAKQPSVSIFSLLKGAAAQNNLPENFLHSYRQNTLACKELTRSRLEQLANFIAEFGTLCVNEAAFFANGEKLIALFNAVINAKEAERYKISRLFGENHADIRGALDELTGKWADIRRILAKLVFANVYNTKKLQGVLEKLKDVYNAELAYHELLISCLENK